MLFSTFFKADLQQTFEKVAWEVGAKILFVFPAPVMTLIL